MKIFNTNLIFYVFLLSLPSLVACDQNKVVESRAGEVEFQILLPGTEPVILKKPIQANESVLEAMTGLQENNTLQFASKKDDLGTLINSIANTSNQSSCPCWVFSVNGKLANKGVDSVILSAGDKIKWCYLKYEDRDKCTDE